MASTRKTNVLRFIFGPACLAMLFTSGAAHAESLAQLPSVGSVCTLTAPMWTRNKPQKKKVKLKKLAQGETFKILKYHRVWTRIQVNGVTAFVRPKLVRKLCEIEAEKELKAKVVVQDPPRNESAAQQVPLKISPAPTAKELESKEKPTIVTLPSAQIPKVRHSVPASLAPLPTGAWVAMGVGAIGLGVSAYFVSKLTREKEAGDAQLGLVTGTTGFIAVMVGLAYWLDRPPMVQSEPENAGISARFDVTPAGVSLSGQF